jgi:hypothetical protein
MTLAQALMLPFRNIPRIGLTPVQFLEGRLQNLGVSVCDTNDSPPCLQKRAPFEHGYVSVMGTH